MKAIETRYKGYRFRSRLEARWAVFFDALGIKWEYEPEGFDLGGGVRYLPDFFLPEIQGGLWVEIKPVKPTSVEQEKLEKLVVTTGKTATFRVGDPMRNVEIGELNYSKDYDADYGWITCLIDQDFDDEFDQSDAPRVYLSLAGNVVEKRLGGDGPYLFCVCNTCLKAGLEFDGRGDRVCGGDHASCHGDKGYSGAHRKIVQAAIKARSARFEFGECGA